MPASARDAASAALVDLLVPLARGKVVAAYASMPDEPGGPDLPDALAAVADRLLLPVLRPDRDLDWALFDGTWTPGRFGLREPAGPRLGVDALATASLVLVPAVAVDRRGTRLGRGGGSYDRALGRAAGTVVAVIFEPELLDWVPAEAHDVAVDAIAVPSGVIWVPSPSGPSR